MLVLTSIRNLRGRISRKECEIGATLVEFAGMAIVVAILIGGALAVAPSHGRDISCSVLSKISEAIGGGGLQCGVADNNAQFDKHKSIDKHKPTEPCTTNQRTRSSNGSVSVAFVDVGNNKRIVTEKLSNGHYRITDMNESKGGVGVGVGAGVELYNDNGSYGASLGASAGGNISRGKGVTYEVNSEKEKNELEAHIRRKQSLPVVGSLGIVSGSMLDKMRGYNPPKPSEFQIQFGAEGSASASAVGGFLGAKAEGAVSHAIGVKVNPKAGTTTTYYKVNGDASAKANVGSSNVSGEGSGEMIVAVTANSKDPDKVLSVSASGMYNAELGAKTPLGLDDPFSTQNHSIGSGKVWTASVDLNSAEASRMARNFLAAARVPGFSNGKGAVENVTEATSTFIGAASDRGVLTRQDVSKNSSKSGGSASLKIGIGFGGDFSSSDETLSFSNGQYYSGGQWNSWEGC